jgi:uncharacterized protein (DUF983 family)
VTDGNECPSCGADIGIWAVLLAPTPNRFSCPRCGERVRYRDTGGVIAAFTVLLIGLLVTAGVAACAVGLDEPVWAAGAFLGVVGLGYVPFELAYALVLRRGGYQLERTRPTPDDWDEI